MSNVTLILSVVTVIICVAYCIHFIDAFEDLNEYLRYVITRISQNINRREYVQTRCQMFKYRFSREMWRLHISSCGYAIYTLILYRHIHTFFLSVSLLMILAINVYALLRAHTMFRKLWKIQYRNDDR